MATRLIELPIEGMDDRDPLSPKRAQGRASRVSNIRSFRDRIERAPGSVEYAPTPIPSASTSGFGVRVGTFTAPTADGTQTITHGLGATPKALLIFTTRQADELPSGGFSQNYRLSTGMTDGTTTRQVTAASHVSSGASRAFRYYSTTILVTTNNVGAVVNSASFVSFNSNTFTLNWTVTSGDAFAVGYMIFGGAGVTADVVEWTLTTAAGNQTTAHGLGGVPQLAIHMTNGHNSAGLANSAIHGYGVMSGTNQWTTAFNQANGVKPARAHRNARSESCLMVLENTENYTENFRLAFSAWDASNFTVTKQVTPSSNATVFTLLMRGITNLSVNGFQMEADDAPVNQSVTDPGFLPTGVLFATAWTPDDGDGKTNVRNGYGAMDTASQWTAHVGGDHASGNNDSVNAFRGTRTFADYGFSSQGFNNQTSVDANFLKTHGRRFSMDPDGFTTEWLKIDDAARNNRHFYVAFGETTTTITDAGLPRTYFQGHFSPAVSVEQAMLFTEKSAWIYNTTTGLYDPTAEAYAAAPDPRWSVVNTQDVVAWTRLGINIRQYDGSSFSNLITSGTNHSAKFLVAFNDRIVSGHTNISGTVDPVMIRWPASGDVNDWSTEGSGVLLIAETNNQPLTGGFVLGERCYLTKQREIIELIATGTTLPVFRQETRVFGTGMLGTHSWAAAEFAVFFLGPDDVYEFDGGRMRSLGSPIYNTMLPFIDYTTIGDLAQAIIRPADSEYWLLIEPYIFIYDFRRDRWFWDTRENVKAIGSYTVGTILTVDVDQSTFPVAGMQDTRTLRFTPTVLSFDDNDIDSYIETRDYYSQQFTATADRVTVVDTLEKQNSMKAFRFNGTPDTTFECAFSIDRGITWSPQFIQTNAQGLGVAYWMEPFQVIRFRVRSTGTNDFTIYGPMAYDYETAGIALPGVLPDSNVDDANPDA